MKKMGKILPVEAVVGAAMLKNKGWLRGRICFENEVVYTEIALREINMSRDAGERRLLLVTLHT